MRAESWTEIGPLVEEIGSEPVTYDHFRSVCRRHNRDTERFLHAIHFVQKGREYTFV